MERIRPFWRIVLGFVIFCFCVAGTNNLFMGESYGAFAFWWAFFVAYIFLCVKIKYDDPVRSMRDLMARQVEEEQFRREQKQATAGDKNAVEQQSLIVEAAEQEGREEWTQKHGRIVTAIAGVTFKNDDGNSRQAILKDIKARSGDAELALEEYEHKGKAAIRVLVDGDQIGNIPRSRVAEVSAVLDKLEDARLEVETFRPENEEDEDGNIRRRGELIYRADLYLVYSK